MCSPWITNSRSVQFRPSPSASPALTGNLLASRVAKNYFRCPTPCGFTPDCFLLPPKTGHNPFHFSIPHTSESLIFPSATRLDLDVTCSSQAGVRFPFTPSHFNSDESFPDGVATRFLRTFHFTQKVCFWFLKFAFVFSALTIRLADWCNLTIESCYFGSGLLGPLTVSQPFKLTPFRTDSAVVICEGKRSSLQMWTALKKPPTPKEQPILSMQWIHHNGRGSHLNGKGQPFWNSDLKLQPQPSSLIY